MPNGNVCESADAVPLGWGVADIGKPCAVAPCRAAGNTGHASSTTILDFSTIFRRNKHTLNMLPLCPFKEKSLPAPVYL